MREALECVMLSGGYGVVYTINCGLHEKVRLLTKSFKKLFLSS